MKTSYYKTKLIMPCFNESSRFDAAAYEKSLLSEEHISICFVNDGSTDDTIEKLKLLQSKFPARIEICDLKENVGKAEAVRRGVLQVADTSKEFKYLGYFDSDLAFPLEQVGWFYNHLPKDKIPAMIVGARVKLHGYSNIERPLMRHLFGRFFATRVSGMLKLSIYDTQTGAKLIRQDTAKELFEEEFISKWLFDIELISRNLAKHGYEGIKDELWEIPVRECNDDGDSNVKKSFMFKLPFELRKIRKKYRTRIS